MKDSRSEKGNDFEMDHHGCQNTHCVIVMTFE